MTFIIVDTEYTTWPGALEGNWSAPGQHREIVQIGAIRVDSDFRETDAFDVLVRPNINPVLSNIFVELTGITQEDVDFRGMPFETAFGEFLAFADAPIICMNGDGGVFRENCSLNGISIPTPFTFHRLRPFIESLDIDLGKTSSGELHTLTPTPILGHTHNALHDVRSMAVWLHHAWRRRIFDIDHLPTDIPTIDPRSNLGKR